MNSISHIFIITGLLLILAGLLLSGRLGPFGRLPGDIIISKPNFTFYFPITTLLIISIIISFILWLTRR